MAAAFVACGAGAAAIAILLFRDGHEKPLRIVALGPRASGKTLLLSSLYTSLSRFAPPSQPYLLDAVDSADGDTLIAIDNKLRTGKGWPDSTPVGNLHPFELDCIARSDGVRGTTLFRIGYLDYGGETLGGETPGGETPDGETPRADIPENEGANAAARLPDLQAHVKRAGGLLGIIDGAQVVALLDGDEKRRSDAQDYFITRMGTIEVFLGSAPAPFQFVVTKWDIVDRNKAGDARLKEVIATLREHTQLNNLVDAATANEIVRIIPVTAVGWDFADLGEAGASVKRGGRQPKPWNVEIPLAALVIDRLAQIERSLQGRALDRLKELIRKRDWRRGRVVAGKAALPVAMGTIVPVAGTIVGVVFMDYLARKYELPPIVDDDFGLKAEERCRRRTIEHFHMKMLEFEDTFKSSILSHD